MNSIFLKDGLFFKLSNCCRNKTSGNMTDIFKNISSYIAKYIGIWSFMIIWPRFSLSQRHELIFHLTKSCSLTF